MTFDSQANQFAAPALTMQPSGGIMRKYPALVIRMLRSILLVSLDGGGKWHCATGVGHFAGTFFSNYIQVAQRMWLRRALGDHYSIRYTVRCFLADFKTSPENNQANRSQPHGRRSLIDIGLLQEGFGRWYRAFTWLLKPELSR